MLTIGLASYALSDTGQQRAREQREREAALNLAEAVLYSQGFTLATTWPGNSAGGAAMPTVCSSAAVVSLCPDPRTLAAGNAAGGGSANFDNVDVAGDTTWTTRIRDNGGPIADAFVYGQADVAQSGTNVKTRDAYSCAAPVQVGCQRRPHAVGPGPRDRPRTPAQPRRAAQARAVRARCSPAATPSRRAASRRRTPATRRSSTRPARRSSSAARRPTTNARSTRRTRGRCCRRRSCATPTTPPAMSAQQRARFMAAALSASPSTYYTSCPASLTGARLHRRRVDDLVQRRQRRDVQLGRKSPGIVIMPRGMLSMKGSILRHRVHGQRAERDGGRC